MKEGWEYKKLGEVCETSSGGTPSRSHIEYYEGGTIPWLRSGEVAQGMIYNSELYITESGLNNSSAKLFPVDTVVIAMYGATVGQVGVLKRDMTTNQAICGILPNKILNPCFLMYTLRAKKAIFIKDAVGGAQPNISQNIIKNTSIPIPSITEQQQIVSELDLLSDVIEKKKAQIEELDKLEQSTFYDMFGDPVSNEKGWIIRKLGDICDVRDGTHDSPSYLLSSDYVLITSKNIQGDSIDFSTANFISKEDYDNINKRSYVDDGDIIMAMIGTIGKPIIVKRNDINFCIKNVALIKFNDKDEVLNIYVKGLLDNGSYICYIQGLNKGGTQKFVALGTLRGLKVPLPPLALQQEFAAKIEAIEQMKAKVRQSLKESEELFNSRMDYYFN
jgi:type I restriction enzyme S subunit